MGWTDDKKSVNYEWEQTEQTNEWALKKYFDKKKLRALKNGDKYDKTTF